MQVSDPRAQQRAQGWSCSPTWGLYSDRSNGARRQRPARTEGRGRPPTATPSALQGHTRRFLGPTAVPMGSNGWPGAGAGVGRDGEGHGVWGEELDGRTLGEWLRDMETVPAPREAL